MKTAEPRKEKHFRVDLPTGEIKLFPESVFCSVLITTGGLYTKTSFSKEILEITRNATVKRIQPTIEQCEKLRVLCDKICIKVQSLPKERQQEIDRAARKEFLNLSYKY